MLSEGSQFNRRNSQANRLNNMSTKFKWKKKSTGWEPRDLDLGLEFARDSPCDL